MCWDADGPKVHYCDKIQLQVQVILKKIIRNLKTQALRVKNAK